MHWPARTLGVSPEGFSSVQRAVPGAAVVPVWPVVVAVPPEVVVDVCPDAVVDVSEVLLQADTPRTSRQQSVSTASGRNFFMVGAFSLSGGLRRPIGSHGGSACATVALRRLC